MKRWCLDEHFEGFQHGQRGSIELKQNLEEGRSDSFGLFEASEQYEFREQFVAFSKADYTQMQRFPLIYEFVKH
ncbi:18330_t:CDS:2 [Entrophospora sp. SA101]|nr:18330_t:CDS:2 [Entrophospora sp. SA101]